MFCQTYHLKDRFPFLGDEGRDPTLQVLLTPSVNSRLKTDAPHPGVLICPGGGYSMCSPREATPVGLPFAAKGYHIFILNYSVAPHRFPAQQIEVAAAMELLHENAEAWNLDAGRIAIMGFSAGGHVAGAYACDYDCDEVRAVFPQSKPVSATILGYPVITADPDRRHTGSFRNLLGHLPEEGEIARFSLENRVTDRTPPTFLWHTATDQMVPVENTYLFAAALAKHGVAHEVHIYPAGVHGLATVDAYTNDTVDPFVGRANRWFADANAFLAHYL